MVVFLAQESSLLAITSLRAKEIADLKPAVIPWPPKGENNTESRGI